MTYFPLSFDKSFPLFNILRKTQVPVTKCEEGIGKYSSHSMIALVRISITDLVCFFQMFHPYLIDTSVIYNLTGTRQKTGLRKLTSLFLRFLF